MSYAAGKVPRQGSELRKQSVVIFGLPLAQPAVTVQPSTGGYSFSGIAPTTFRRIAPSVGSYTYTGVSGSARVRPTPPVRTYTWSGLTAQTKLRVPPATIAVFTWSGLNALGPIYIPVGTGVFTWSGIAPTLRRRATPSIASVSVSGIAPAKLVRRVAPPVGVIQWFGIPLIPQGIISTPTSGVLTWSGITVTKLRFVAKPPITTHTYSGLVPVTKRGARPNTTSYTFSGIPPTKLRFRISAGFASFTFFYFGATPATLVYRARPPVRAFNFQGQPFIWFTVLRSQPSTGIVTFRGMDGYVPSVGGLEPEVCTIQIWEAGRAGPIGNLTIVPVSEAPVTMTFVPEETVR